MLKATVAQEETGGKDDHAFPWPYILEMQHGDEDNYQVYPSNKIICVNHTMRSHPNKTSN